MDLFALDVNLHGMFLLTAAPVPVGSLLQLSIALPDGEAPITAFVTARFVGRTVSGMGIGAEMHIMEPVETKRWESFYQSALKSQDKSSTDVELSTPNRAR